MAEPATLMPPGEACAMMRAEHFRQNLEALFLRIIKAPVERLLGVGEFLQIRCHCIKHLGVPVQTFDRIGIWLLIGARSHAFGTSLGHIADRSLNGRPVFFLLGLQLEPCLDRCNARVCKCLDVFGRRLPTPPILAI
jgi:hypothetical protein